MRLAQAAVRAAFAKKCSDVVVLDMSGAVTYTDLFVLISGATTRQTHAIAESIRRNLRENGMRPVRVEGERSGDWILLDYLDAVVHIFTPQAREFYRLESLWGDVPRVTPDEAEEEAEWRFLLQDGDDAPGAAETA